MRKQPDSYHEPNGKGSEMTVTTIRRILGDRPLHSVSPDKSVRDAAAIMATQSVGALAVISDGNLVGILSERDIVFRCVGADLPTADTPVSEIMTRDPVTLGIDETISDGLALKLGDAFRHLPVLDGETVVGLLSYRDIPPEYVMMFERFREMSSAHADDTGA